MRHVLIVLGLLIAASVVRAQDSALYVERVEHVGNLTIALIAGPDQTQHAYATLEQALKDGTAIIHERNSQTLHIDNLGEHDLFVQSGDLIKGGQQDRMIANDLILDPRSKAQELTVFCIEKGRSTKRGEEPLETFSSSTRSAPIPHLRAMAKHELSAKLLTPRVGGMTAPDPQQLQMLEGLAANQPFQFTDPAQEAIWHDVDELQASLTRSVHDSITKNSSPTSLELSLEKASELKRGRKLESQIADVAHTPRTIGYLYAIGSVIYGGDVYGSHALFITMWPKLARAVAAHALSEDTLTGSVQATDFEDYLRAFTLETQALSDYGSRTEVHAAESRAAYLFVTYDKASPSGWLHRQYVTK